jgi:hypothetical protein
MPVGHRSSIRIDGGEKSVWMNEREEGGRGGGKGRGTGWIGQKMGAKPYRMGATGRNRGNRQ